MARCGKSVSASVQLGRRQSRQRDHAVEHEKGGPREGVLADQQEARRDRGKTYQAIFWPFMIGILAAVYARVQHASAMDCGRFPLEGGVAGRICSNVGYTRASGERRSLAPLRNLLAAQVPDEVSISEFTEGRQPCSGKV
jgi:hypothetical protein